MKLWLSLVSSYSHNAFPLPTAFSISSMFFVSVDAVPVFNGHIEPAQPNPPTFSQKNDPIDSQNNGISGDAPTGPIQLIDLAVAADAK